MRFRPCIDIHNGQVKQIVGGSLLDRGSQAQENFVSQQDASFYAELYQKHSLNGGHIILLNPQGTDYYKADKQQAFKALRAYPNGLQVGGGITAENAEEFIRAGASHVIVTSYAFKQGQIYYENIEKLKNAVGREHLVLDLSCRKKDGAYYIVTDRWQKFTETAVTEQILEELSRYCDEYMIHAVDVEGKAHGIEEELAVLLGQTALLPTTYAGGVGSFADLEKLYELGGNHLDVTVGSALDIFGGTMSFQDVLEFCKGTESRR